MQEMTLRELCKKCDVSRRTVQGYEKAGLVNPSGKNKMGHLLYDEKSQKRIGRVAFDFSVKDEEYEIVRKPVGMDLVIATECKEALASGEVLYDEGGIRMISMGLIEDSHGYSEDIHWLIIAENDTDEKLNVRDVNDSLSVNGFMMDFYTWGRAYGFYLFCTCLYVEMGVLQLSSVL